MHPSAWGALGGAAGAGAVLVAQQLLFPAPAPATIDLARLIAAEARRADLARIEEREVAAAAVRAAARIRGAVSALAAERRLVVLVQGAAVAGAPDITPLVARRLGLELVRPAAAPPRAPASGRRPGP